MYKPLSFDAQKNNEAPYVLSKEEVLLVIWRHVDGNYTIVQELFDDSGRLYMLEVRVGGGNPGEFDAYRYQRKGEFGQNATSKTTLQIFRYINDEPVGGKTLADYDEETRTWKSAE